jgi:phosphatidylglycerophosphate synthase
MLLGWRLPPRPLRDGAIRALTLGATGVVLAATLARPWLEVSQRYPQRAVVVFAVTMGVAIGHLHRSHPFPRLGAANRITAVRLMLVSLIAGILGERLAPHVGVGVAVAGIATTALDGVDGLLARRTRVASVFGARFDMEVDAFFVLVLSVLVWRAEKAGAWIVLAGLMRYLFVAAMLLLPWLRRETPPRFRRKAIAVVQMLGLSSVMLPLFAPPFSTLVCATALIMLVYSFGADTLWLWRHRA